ncbi:putative ribonuclease H-like domain-containing protein [Tanacetum coccineum]
MGSMLLSPHHVRFGDLPNLIVHHLSSTGNPQMYDKGFVDSGCSRHMTGNLAYLSNFIEYDGGYVTFGGGAYGGRITGKCTLRTNNLDFEDVHFVKELKFNLFSVSQMCDKKNYVLFTDTECLVLSPDFKLPDENQILLRIPREDNMYSFHMHNIVPKGNLTCLVAKATTDESMLWYRRLGHINFKNINKLVKENIVRGLPLKQFVNDQTCVACLKEAVSTACYVQNRVLIVKPHFKTPYELFRGLKPALSFMKPFGCHVTILNILDSLGKFDGKSDNGFFVGYSLSSNAFRVYNTRTRKVEENLHIGLLENKPMLDGNGPEWLFDIESLTKSMNYVPVSTGTTNHDSVGIQDKLSTGISTRQEGSSKDYVVMPIWRDTSYFDSSTKNHDPKSVDDDPKENENDLHDVYDDKGDESSFKEINTAVNTVDSENMFGDDHSLKATQVEFVSDEDEPEVELGNMPNTYDVPTTPHTRIHKDHPPENVIGDIKSSVQTRRSTTEQGFLSAVYDEKKHAQLNTYLFSCFLSQMEPNRVTKALSDPAWVEAMQEELLQFELQKVWILVDLPKGKRPIGLKWIFKNKTDERGIVIRNKARGKIDPTLFIKRQKGDILLVQVYVDDIIFGSTKKEICNDFEKLMKDKFQMSSMGELTFFLVLQVKQKKDGIFISQDKYVAEILRKFNYTDVKSASIIIDLDKPFTKDGDAEDVDVHLYRSMIGSLMYLTASRLDIMFAVCVCARFQVTPKTSHLTAIGILLLVDAKKQTIVATSTTKAEYVAAANCYGQNTIWLHSWRSLQGLRVFIKTTKAHTKADGEIMITANIDGQIKTLTEASLRRHLKLEDQDGLDILPNTEIFEQLALMGYNTDSNRLTFQKGTFSPQWRFLIHTVLHCLSPKKIAWEHFSSNIAIAIICLATNRKYNFSKLIFDHMRPTKGYSGVEVALFPDMLNVPTSKSSPEPSTSPSRITSSPSPSTEHSSEPSHEPSTAILTSPEPQSTQPLLDVDNHVSTPHDSPLHAVHIHESEEGSMQLSELTNLVTKLTSRVAVLETIKKLETKVKQGRARRRAKLVLSEEEIDSQDDSSKQGRNISDKEKDQETVLIDENGVEWIQEEIEVQERVSNETEVVVQDGTPTEVIEDKGSEEKGEKQVSTAELPINTAGVTVSTAEETPILSSTPTDISTASTIHTGTRGTAGRVVYSRRVKEQKDKGKVIMTKPEPKKKSKKEIEQE